MGNGIATCVLTMETLKENEYCRRHEGKISLDHPYGSLMHAA